MKLTLQAIIRWEQLRNKSFIAIDYSNEDDLIAMFYVRSLYSSPLRSLSEFKKTLDKKTIHETVKEFEKESTVMAQFQPIANNENTENTESTPGFVKDVVAMLIVEGMSPDYVLNSMRLCDLPLFVSALDKKKREKLEASRLWTYISILPHLSKRISSPQALYPFPWEIEQMKKDADNAIIESSSAFEKFMQTGKAIFQKLKNNK